jgi:hypothetical protein
MEHNFDQQISDGDDVGAYDYGSIMHYPRDAFSTDGSDTITPTNAAAAIGQRTALSAGDIAAANSMCGGGGVATLAETTLAETTTIAESLAEHVHVTEKELVVETIKERVPETRKELVVETIKERAPETRKELVNETIKEQINDTAKEQVPETRKEEIESAVENIPRIPFGGGVGPMVNPNPGVFGGPGAVPFAMRTPHAGLGDAQGDAAAAEGLLAQLAAVHAAMDANADDAAMLASQRDQLVAALGQLGWQ